jgi:thioesterase domain-containing protein/acyl carrier protein
VAYIVTMPEKQISPQQIRTYLHKYLPDNMCPTHVVLLEKLPLTPNGKIDRRALPAVNHTAQLPDISIKARDTLEFQLVKIWEDILDRQPIGITDNFFDLGGHSMLAVRLLSRLQKEYHCELTLSILFQYPTIASLAVFLRQQRPPEQWSILVPLQTGGTQPPLFCIHPSGGTVFCYTDLARSIGQDFPFYGLQTPDLDGKGRSFHTIQDIVEHYASAIQTVQAHGPYHLSGWSLGGVVAFAIAEYLQTQGEDITLVAIFDSIAPISIQQQGAEITDEYVDNDQALVNDLLELFAWDIPKADLFILPPKDQLQCLLEQAKKMFVVPEDTTLAQFRRLARLHRTNMHAISNYHPQKSTLPIALFRAQDTMSHTHLPVHAQAETLGWEALTNTIEVITVPGSHGTMLNEPYVQELARLFRNHLGSIRK